MLFIIGQITLNISFFLYLFLLWPQIVHNARQASIQNLSFTMHLILVLAYISDLVYGFGQHFPWQYKAVTISGLLCLAVQHYQFWTYPGKPTKLFFYLGCLLLYVFGALNLLFWEANLQSKASLIFGFISQIGWLVYTIPQIIRNFITRSVKVLSPYFVGLALMVTVCDTISAWTLNWALPSKLGAPCSLIFKLILLIQYYYWGLNKEYFAQSEN